MYRKCSPVRLRHAILPNDAFLDILSCFIGKGNAIFSILSLNFTRNFVLFKREYLASQFQITPPKNGIHTSKPFIQISTLSTPLFATLHSYSTLRSYFYGKQNQQMNRREEHFQFLGICQRLYNFITMNQAFKTVKLGPSAISDANPNEAGTKRDRKVHPMTREDETREVSTVAHLAEAPKKLVSINNRVEDIEEAVKLRRKSKSFEKLNSLELGRDEPRALRSILKVDSDLSGKVGTFVNSTTTRCS